MTLTESSPMFLLCAAEHDLMSRTAFLTASANETLLHALGLTFRSENDNPYTLRETFGALFLGTPLAHAPSKMRTHTLRGILLIVACGEYSAFASQDHRG